MNFEPIAYLYNDFPTKFGLPRQSGMSEHLLSRVVMEEAYRSREAFRGIKGFDYLWLICGFESRGKRDWSPPVRPPKLGGNQRMGVFATRSPNRPTPIGLTRVKLISVEEDTVDAPALIVAGADLMSGTAILDIKPYLPFADSVPDASDGLYGAREPLKVELPERFSALFSEQQFQALRETLAHDPRPGYQSDPDRVYGFAYAGYDVRFRVADNTLTVTDIVREPCE